MTDIGIPMALSALAHLIFLIVNVGYTPVSYEVMSAPESVELSIAAGGAGTEKKQEMIPMKEAVPVATPAREEKTEETKLLVEQEKPTQEFEGSENGKGSEGQGGADANSQLALEGSTGVSARSGSGNRPPKYPKLARKLGYEGTVLLHVEVTADGNASEVRIQQSSGYPVLDEAAQKAIAKWKFQPAQRFGAPVPASLLIPVIFDLEMEMR